MNPFFIPLTSEGFLYDRTSVDILRDTVNDEAYFCSLGRTV